MIFFVNATAAEIGGLYTIVDQFLQSIRTYDNQNKYYIFVSNNKFDKYNNGNINVIRVNKKGWIKRFYWDAFGLKAWARNNNIIPDKIVSLQNTPVRFPNIPQIIYLHTSIPFINYRWKITRKNNRKMWFYKNIYPFFIKLFLNQDCELIVQANWLKKSILKEFSIHEEYIHVIKPNVKINIDVAPLDNKTDNSTIFFYPALDYIYKNHLTILKSLEKIKSNHNSIYKKMKVIFTLDNNSWVYQEACKLKIEDCISFVGNLSFKEVLKYYSQANVVLFPSYIETFGLPLIEAAYFNKNIICSNEEYAKEALSSYRGVSYVNAFDTDTWVRQIINSLENSEDTFEFHYKDNVDSWKLFFDLIKRKKVL